jgi:hypothetical protein
MNLGWIGAPKKDELDDHRLIGPREAERPATSFLETLCEMESGWANHIKLHAAPD